MLSLINKNMTLFEIFQHVYSDEDKETEKGKLRGGLRQVVVYLIDTNQEEKITELQDFYLQLLNPALPQVCHHQKNASLFRIILKALVKLIGEDTGYRFMTNIFGQREPDDDGRTELVIRMFQAAKATFSKARWRAMMSTNPHLYTSIGDLFIRQQVHMPEEYEDKFKNYGPLAKLFRFILQEQAAVIRKMDETERSDEIGRYSDLLNVEVIEKGDADDDDYDVDGADDDYDLDDDDDGLNYEFVRYFFDFFVESGQEKDMVLNSFASQLKEKFPSLTPDDALERIKRGLENAKRIFMSKDRLGILSAIEVPAAERKREVEDPVYAAQRKAERKAEREAPQSKKVRFGSPDLDSRAAAVANVFRKPLFAARGAQFRDFTKWF